MIAFAASVESRLARTPFINTCTLAFISADSGNGHGVASFKSYQLTHLGVVEAVVATSGTLWQNFPFAAFVTDTILSWTISSQAPMAPQKKRCCVFVASHFGSLTNACWSKPGGLTDRHWFPETATDDEVYDCASSIERALSEAAWSSITLSSKSLCGMQAGQSPPCFFLTGVFLFVLWCRRWKRKWQNIY